MTDKLFQLLSIPARYLWKEKKPSLVEIKGSERIATASQIETGSPPRLWWVLSGTTPADSKRVYELVEGSSPEVSGIEVTKNDSFLEIQAGNKKIFRYRLYVHEGKADVNDVERIWRDYAEPPNVRVELTSGAKDKKD